MINVLLVLIDAAAANLRWRGLRALWKIAAWLRWRRLDRYCYARLRVM